LRADHHDVLQARKPLTLFEEAYWKRPDSRDQGDENPDATYRAVGYALTQWEHADQELSHLFMCFTQAGWGFLSIHRVYGSIMSNAGRRAAVLAAAEVYFGSFWSKKAVRTPLMNIINIVQWGSERRDDIAHGIVLPKVVIDEKDHGAFLFPAEYNTHRTYAFGKPGASSFLDLIMKAKYRYVAEDIERIGNKFIEIKKAIQDFIPEVNVGRDEIGAECKLVTRVLEEEAKAGKT
jgi:hypothetical protein